MSGHGRALERLPYKEEALGLTPCTGRGPGPTKRIAVTRQEQDAQGPIEGSSLMARCGMSSPGHSFDADAPAFSTPVQPRPDAGHPHEDQRTGNQSGPNSLSPRLVVRVEYVIVWTQCLWQKPRPEP